MIFFLSVYNYILLHKKNKQQYSIVSQTNIKKFWTARNFRWSYHYNNNIIIDI